MVTCKSFQYISLAYETWFIKHLATYSPMYPLEVDMNEASSISLYFGPISIRTFLKEWKAEPSA